MTGARPSPKVFVPIIIWPEESSDTGVRDNCMPVEPGSDVVPAMENPVGFAVITWWPLDADAPGEVVSIVPLP